MRNGQKGRVIRMKQSYMIPQVDFVSGDELFTLTNSGESVYGADMKIIFGEDYNNDLDLFD